MNSTSNTILKTITEIFNSMFSSIDTSIYSALDTISFIDTNIIHSTYLEKLLGSSSSNGILLIANSLLIGFILYFTIRFLLSNFSIIQPQNPYRFFIKIIFIGICMNSSFFICEQIINLNSLISSSIREVGNSFLNTDICFTNLINIFNSIVCVEEETQSIFSIDGILKTTISVRILKFNFCLLYTIYIN